MSVTFTRMPGERAEQKNAVDWYSRYKNLKLLHDTRGMCLSKSLIEAYTDGRTIGNAKQIITDHIDVCGTCRGKVIDAGYMRLYNTIV